MQPASVLISVCGAVVLLGICAAPGRAGSGSSENLVAAVKAGDALRVEKLLAEGASPDSRDEQGLPVLAVAARAGNASLVKILLSKGADVNATSKDADEKTKLADIPVVWHAAAVGSPETLRLLLQAGANPNAREAGLGMTPLMAAASFGNTETVRALIAAKVGLEVRDLENRTALMWAADLGSYETARLLLDAGAQVDALGELGSPPLMYAAQHGFDDVVALLVERGADVNRKATPGLTALDLAKQNHQTLTVQLLENGGRQEPPGPAFQRLRPMLYPESPLEAVWLKVATEDKTVEAARQLALKGELRQALDVLEVGREKHQGQTGYGFELGYLQQQTGDRAAALASFRKLLATPDLGSRETLRLWKLIRTLGEAPPPDQSKRVLGVVVEVGLGSDVLSIAAYADGQPRYFLGTGGGIIGETWTEEETKKVQEIVHLAEDLVDGMEPTESRELPKPGRVRFTILTPGGSYGEEDSFSSLSHGQGRCAKVFAASDQLVGMLGKHAAPEHKN
jgi:ankyrin repeat protein